MYMFIVMDEEYNEVDVAALVQERATINKLVDLAQRKGVKLVVRPLRPPSDVERLLRCRPDLPGGPLLGRSEGVVLR